MPEIKTTVIPHENKSESPALENTHSNILSCSRHNNHRIIIPLEQPLCNPAEYINNAYKRILQINEIPQRTLKLSPTRLKQYPLDTWNPAPHRKDCDFIMNKTSSSE